MIEELEGADVDTTTKPRIFAPRNLDLIFVSVITIAVVALIGRIWVENAALSSQMKAMTGMRNARLEGFRYQTNEGLKYYLTKDYVKAEKAFSKSIEYSPDNALGYSNLGSALNDQKKWDEAILVLQLAVGLNPDLPIARNNLAWAQSHRDQEANRGR